MRTSSAALRSLTLALAAMLVSACGSDDEQPALADVPESPSHAGGGGHSPGLSAEPPLGLPGAGKYAYVVSGTAGGGALPAESSLTVEDVPDYDYRQRWTIERPESGGQNSTEVLEIVGNFDGLRLVSRTISQASPAGPVVVEFAAPANPILFVPHYKKPGEWEFDLDSKDGCFTNNTKVFVREPNAPIAVGSANYTAYHVELVSTLKGLGKAGCVALEVTSTEKLWLDRESFVPVKGQTIREGKLDGASLAADVTTDVRSTTPS